MDDRSKEQINELARRIFRKKMVGSNPYITFEFTKLYSALQSRSIGFGRSFNISDDDIYSAFHDAIMKSIGLYDGIKDFLPFYKIIYVNKLKDECRKNKHKNVLSLDEECFDEDGDLQGSRHDIVPDKTKNVSAQVENRDAVSNILLSIATFIKKMKKNKTHYSSLFFTNGLVYTVFNTEDQFAQTLQCNSNRFDEVVVNEFMNSLLTGECSSVTEIKKFERRLLFEFTEKESDKDKTCCDDFYPKYCVVNCYLKKHDKGISQSAFSQQKEKYINMLKSIGEEIDLVD